MKPLIIMFGSATMCSIGSMLAIDRPFIASAFENDVDICGSVCLEYGSATQLYLVPYVRQGEQVHSSFTAHYIIGETAVITSVGIRYVLD